MRRISTESAWNIFRVNFHLAIQNHMIPALCYLALIPLVRGIANLDAVRSAECLEQSVVLIGIFLIVPLSAPERPEAIRELVAAKKIQMWTILLIRIVMAIFLLTIMTGIFAGLMISNHCTFPYIKYAAGTVVREVVLGSAGLLVSVLCNSVEAGYLTSIGYFLFNFLGDLSSKSGFYLFSMGAENDMTEVWLAGLGLLLLVITLLLCGCGRRMKNT